MLFFLALEWCFSLLLISPNHDFPIGRGVLDRRTVTVTPCQDLIDLHAIMLYWYVNNSFLHTLVEACIGGGVRVVIEGDGGHGGS